MRVRTGPLSYFYYTIKYLLLTHCSGGYIERGDTAFGGNCICEKQPGHFLQVEKVKLSVFASPSQVYD